VKRTIDDTPAGTASCSVGLIGECNPAFVAHRAIPVALQLAGAAQGVAVEARWLSTDTLRVPEALQELDGVWCVPGSPYLDTEAALAAIRFARERKVPYLGTCGGFQHAVLEYARDVLGWADAAHAELEPHATRLVIAPLACALVEQQSTVKFVAGSRVARAYGVPESNEGYHCSYGINPDIVSALIAGPLHATAFDLQGEIRALELAGHPFFVATLFQPERAALEGRVPPLVAAFLTAILTAKGARG
jgi:CTP synthase (UTP-ammonia lyase)